MIADPSAARVAADLEEGNFLSGRDAGHWRVISFNFPTLDFAISATEPDGSYACWAVPVDEVVPYGATTRDDILQRGNRSTYPGWNTGVSRSMSIAMRLREADYPLMNAWTFQGFQMPVAAVRDDELADPTLERHVDQPRRHWSRNCERSGDTVAFSQERHGPGIPFGMRLEPETDETPTQFTLPGGTQLNAGDKMPREAPSYAIPKDQFYPENPFYWSAAASGPKRVIYIAEAHILTLESPSN